MAVVKARAAHSLLTANCYVRVSDRAHQQPSVRAPQPKSLPKSPQAASCDGHARHFWCGQYMKEKAAPVARPLLPGVVGLPTSSAAATHRRRWPRLLRLQTWTAR